MKRFVGLDGIKGLALIAIVLYHCMQQRLPGGFYGVDVFFTVSGFLIAVSLIRSLAKTGSLNLVRYIPKRAVRLYPALFLLIPVIVSVGWLFDHDILVSIRDQVITVLLAAAYRNFCGALDWFSLSVGGVGVSRGGVEFVPVDAGPVCGRDAVVRFGRRCLFALPQGVGDE